MFSLRRSVSDMEVDWTSLAHSNTLLPQSHRHHSSHTSDVTHPIHISTLTRVARVVSFAPSMINGSTESEFSGQLMSPLSFGPGNRVKKPSLRIGEDWVVHSRRGSGAGAICDLLISPIPESFAASESLLGRRLNVTLRSGLLFGWS